MPNAAVKEILTQLDSEGKRGHWIAKIMEYDIEIKPTKLVKGQGLAKLLIESNCQALGLNVVSDEIFEQEEFQHEEEKKQILQKYEDSDWYADFVYFLLLLQSPPNLDKGKFRSLKLKAMDYCLHEHDLFWKDPGGILLRCIDREEGKALTAKMHEGFCGGHDYWKATTFKILRAGYY